MFSNRINTKFIGHHVSAGGFIFYKDQHSDQIYTVLVKNKRGEWWIPKGHLEENEDDISASLREIQEETGLKKDQLTYIDFSHLYSFSFTDENGKQNTKDVYMHVFESKKKYDLTVERNETADVCDAAWVTYEQALELILSFSKNDLIRAQNIYITYLEKLK